MEWIIEGLATIPMEYYMGIVPVVLLVLGFPIFIILLATASIVLIVHQAVPPMAMHINMFGSVDKFALMAVPFFIFAGEIMGQGGISKRIVAWVMSIIGSVRGSLALTTVGTCTVFGAISGSSPATVAAVGRLLYQPMRNAGYTERFSSGLISSSGAIATVIPPSIGMILYGASAEQSVALLFIAGVIPGLLIAALMATYIYIYALRTGIRESSGFSLTQFLTAS